MGMKFPGTFQRDNGDSPFEDEGLTRLTIAGREWNYQLGDLSNDEIKVGIENLRFRDEKNFPPSAMVFRDLCVGNEVEDVTDAILCRLQDGDQYQWTNELAFNIWLIKSGEFTKSSEYNIPKLIKHRMNVLDRTSMFPLPDYEALQIAPPVKVDANEKERSVFQGHMYSSILQNDPKLFVSNKIQSVKDREFNREPSADIPLLMKKIFSKDGTNGLIAKFKATGNDMPVIPIRPDFLNFSAIDWAKDFRRYKNKAVDVMTEFLIAQQILKPIDIQD